MIISATNIVLRPKRSDRPPRPTAPTRMPNRLAAPMTPCSAEPILNSLGKKRKRDAGHEDDEAFEEFARGGKPPDQPLHPGHRRRLEVGAVGPNGQFVDMVLNRSCAAASRNDGGTATSAIPRYSPPCYSPRRIFAGFRPSCNTAAADAAALLLENQNTSRGTARRAAVAPPFLVVWPKTAMSHGARQQHLRGGEVERCGVECASDRQGPDRN